MCVFLFQLLNSGNFNSKRDACTEADIPAETKDTPSSSCSCNTNVRTFLKHFVELRGIK